MTLQLNITYFARNEKPPELYEVFKVKVGEDDPFLFTDFYAISLVVL